MNSRTARSNALLLRFVFICVRIVCISVPIKLILEPDYLRTLLRLVAVWDSSVLRGPVQEREGAWGFVKNQKRLSICCGVVEMKVHLWFRITSIVVFLQIALGGLLTFRFITSLPHIITGFAVLAFAIVTLVVAQTLKPPFRPLQGLSVGLVLLIIVQIILGFTTLSTGNLVIAWVHLLVAMGIYGMVIAGTFMSMRLDYRAREQSVPSVGPQA